MAFSLTDVISMDRVLSPVLCSSKKRVFEEIAKTASLHIKQLSVKELLYNLNLREEAGSTYIGNGFAMPLVVVADDVAETAVFAINATPVHYDSFGNTFADVFLALFLHANTIQQNNGYLEKVAMLFADVARIRYFRSIENIQAHVFNAVNSLLLTLDSEQKEQEEVDRT